MVGHWTSNDILCSLLHHEAAQCSDGVIGPQHNYGALVLIQISRSLIHFNILIMFMVSGHLGDGFIKSFSEVMM